MSLPPYRLCLATTSPSPSPSSTPSSSNQRPKQPSAPFIRCTSSSPTVPLDTVDLLVVDLCQTRNPSSPPPPNKTPVVGHLHESARKPPAPCDQAEALRGQSLLFTGTTRGSEFFPSQDRSAQHHPIMLSSFRLLSCSRSQVW